MSNHHKDGRSTGAVDKDRAGKRTKMNREERNTDTRSTANADVRGKGRQAVEQTKRVAEFDEKVIP